MEIVPLDALLPHPRNARRGNVDVIRESLRTHGQYRSIVAQRSTGYILAGNHTYLAARAEGREEIRVEYVDCDDDQALRILLVDNRSSDLASYDDEALYAILNDLSTTELRLDGTGYDVDALNDLLEQVTVVEEAPEDIDDAPEPPAEPRSVVGEVYELGPHRLVCGDATDAAVFELLMQGGKAALTFTDPPYGVDYDGGTVDRAKLIGDGRNTTIYADALPLIARYMSPSAAMYVWHAGTLADRVFDAVRASGYEVRCVIIWNKNQAQFGALSAQYKAKHEPCVYAVPRGRVASWYGPTNEVTVWDVDRSAKNDLHPTQKPVALAERALGNSTRRGDMVLDPFAGSGTTLVACERLGRVARLVEIDPAYCDVIRDRYARITSQSGA